MSSDSKNESSLSCTKPKPFLVAVWYHVLFWPDDSTDQVMLDLTTNVASLQKAIAANVLDPFSNFNKTIHPTNIEIWQVCMSISKKGEPNANTVDPAERRSHPCSKWEQWGGLISAPPIPAG